MKLTKQMREDVLNKAMGEANKAFYKEIEEFKKQEDALGMQAYRETFSPAIRKAINDLPKEWLRDDDCLRFNANGYSLQFTVKERVRVPSREYHCHRLGTITSELAQKMIKWSQDKKDADARHAALRNKIQAMLDSCATIKVLEATWPEGKLFYQYLIDASKQQKAGLPTILLSDINAGLGLVKA